MRLSVFFAVIALSATSAFAKTPCGGTFSGFVQDLKNEAISDGHKKSTVDKFFAGVRQDPKTLKADRSQGVFQMSFTDFSRRLISQNRIDVGR